MVLVPKTSKLEKVVSKDPTHPILLHPFLHKDDETGEAFIYASDAKCAVVIPVEGAEDDTVGPIHTEALKAARKGNGVVKCEPGYCIAEGQVAYPREDSKYTAFPPIDRLLVDRGQAEVEVALNIKQLYALAQAMGTDVVKLRIQHDTNNLPVGVEPHPSEPHVRGARAAMMPYRVANTV